MIAPAILSLAETKILIVDDDPLTRAVLTGWFDHLQISALATSSIAEADTALAAESFDVLLCDVHLPGNENLRWVQAVLARPNSPAVVLITGNPELESTLRAANLAVAGYLVKPLDLDTLHPLCARLVAQRRQQCELLELSRATSDLLADGALDPAIREHLQRLAHVFTAASAASPRTAAASDDAQWRATIAEAILVLEKTKHAFRSKDLGALRVRLESTLRESRAPV